MKKTIALYGVALAVLVFLLRFLEYRYLVRDLSMEFYLSVVAVLFTTVGVWMGLKLTRKKVTVSDNRPFVNNDEVLKERGISSREYEVLMLMAQGYSNQEIADKLFVSLNTIKTHSTNLFSKLDARRRTQAVQKAKELGLIQ